MPIFQKIILISLTFLALIFGWVFIKKSLKPESDLPIYGQVKGEYKFVDQNGKDFKTSSMSGHIWLVNFFFTSCHGPCPIMTAQIAGILSSQSHIHVLSVSTDPETDTSDVLKAYSAKLKTDTSNWTMAFGNLEVVKTFGQDVLKLPVGEGPEAHSTRIVLIDQNSMIRGWYDSQEPQIRDRIIRDIKSL